jgi:hypothetical protein
MSEILKQQSRKRKKGNGVQDSSKHAKGDPSIPKEPELSRSTNGQASAPKKKRILLNAFDMNGIGHTRSAPLS